MHGSSMNPIYMFVTNFDEYLRITFYIVQINVIYCRTHLELFELVNIINFFRPVLVKFQFYRLLAVSHDLLPLYGLSLCSGLRLLLLRSVQNALNA